MVFDTILTCLLLPHLFSSHFDLSSGCSISSSVSMSVFCENEKNFFNLLLKQQDFYTCTYVPSCSEMCVFSLPFLLMLGPYFLLSFSSPSSPFTSDHSPLSPMSGITLSQLSSPTSYLLP